MLCLQGVFRSIIDINRGNCVICESAFYTGTCIMTRTYIPSKITLSADEKVFSLSGDVWQHMRQGNITASLASSGQNVSTVFFDADQRDIGNFAFSRFRKNSHQDLANAYLPQLQELSFHPEIKDLPEIFTTQLLKYMAKGVRFTGSPELLDHIQARLEAYPGYSLHENAGLTPENLAKKLLQHRKTLQDLYEAIRKQQYSMERQASQGVGKVLYVFKFTLGESIAKITTFANNEAQARKELALVLRDSKVVRQNKQLFGPNPLTPSDFSVTALHNNEIYQEYHGRREGPGQVFYLAGRGSTITSSVELKNSQYANNLNACALPAHLMHAETLIRGYEGIAQAAPTGRRFDSTTARAHDLLTEWSQRFSVLFIRASIPPRTRGREPSQTMQTNATVAALSPVYPNYFKDFLKYLIQQLSNFLGISSHPTRQSRDVFFKREKSSPGASSQAEVEIPGARKKTYS
jgi:hypothetical protein